MVTKFFIGGLGQRCATALKNWPPFIGWQREVMMTEDEM